MTIAPVRCRPLRLSLLLLLPLAAAAAAQAALLPRWPQAAPLPQETLRRPLAALGQQGVISAVEPPWRSYELALSALYRIRLPQGLEVQLQRLEVRRRLDLQLATATRPWSPGRRDLALGRRRRLLPAALGHQAEGTLQSRGQTLVLRQTCLLPAGAGVTAEQLTALADQATAGLPAVATRMLGLRPNRSWRCLMVSLSTRAGDAQASATAAALWPRLLRVLTPLAS